MTNFVIRFCSLKKEKKKEKKKKKKKEKSMYLTNL